MDEYEGMRKFGREVDKIAGKMREMRASSEVEKMKCGPDGRQSASRERGMTGIERLRGVAGFWRENKLDDIVEQIEREQGGRVSRMRVLSVVTEMERHVSGVEGMGDSPVARWARELRRALKSDTSDERDAQNPSCTGTAEAADVTSEAQKVTREDVDAIAWVREHGGLEELEKRLMPEGVEWPRYDTGELVDFGDEVDRGDGDSACVDKVAFYGDQWRLFDRHGCEINEDMMGPGDRVRRPAPAVLAADGEPLEVGQTVWHEDGTELRVLGFEHEEDGEIMVSVEYVDGPSNWSSVRNLSVTHHRLRAADDRPFTSGQTVYDVDSGIEYRVLGIHIDEENPVRVMRTDGSHLAKAAKPNTLTHRRPVLDADGVSIKVGDTVWMVDDPDGPYRVTEVTTKYATHVHGYSDELGDLDMSPSQLTHERPDSLDRLAEDIGAMVAAWRSNRDLFDAQEAAAGCVGENTLGAALDSLARRAKALAGDA